VICPKCGEDNSDNFRFCGMCGTLLEARHEIRRPAGAPVPGLPKMKTASAPEPQQPLVAENATIPANKQAPPISGAGTECAGHRSTQPESAQFESTQPASAQYGRAAGKGFLRRGFFF
jgi:hypothetical protein